jgi:hypothetical protein
MDITISNQCTSIKLTSPIYFIRDETCHIQFLQQVNPKTIMKTNFRASISRNTFGGILLYHLQWKENANIQLLAIWGCKSDIPYLYAWPIEHENTFIWDKDRLKRLYDVYDSQYITCNSRPNVFSSTEWLLSDGTKLETKRKKSRKGFKMKVTIFEKEYTYYPRRPLWIDSNR